MKTAGSVLLALLLVVASPAAERTRSGFITCSAGLQAPVGGAEAPPYTGCETGRRLQASRPVPFGVGDRIPEFRAPDQDGKERQFSDLVGPKGLVIFFFKSADW